MRRNQTTLTATACLACLLLTAVSHAEKPKERREGKPASILELPAESSVQVFKIDQEGDLILIRGDQAKLPKGVLEAAPGWDLRGADSKAKVLGIVTTVGPDGRVATINLHTGEGEEQINLPAEMPNEVAERVAKVQKRMREAQKEMQSALKRKAEAQARAHEAQDQLKRAQENLRKISALTSKTDEGKPLNLDLQEAVSNAEKALTYLNAHSATISVKGAPVVKYEISGDAALHEGSIPKEVVAQVYAARLHQAQAQASNIALKLETKLDQILGRLSKLETEVAEIRNE